jgi:hypothetical protein
MSAVRSSGTGDGSSGRQQPAQSGQGVTRADQRTHHRVLHRARRRSVLVGRAAGQEMTHRWTTHGSIHTATRPEVGASSTIDGRATGLSREAVSMRTEAPITDAGSDRWRRIFSPPLPHVEGDSRGWFDPTDRAEPVGRSAGSRDQLRSHRRAHPSSTDRQASSASPPSPAELQGRRFAESITRSSTRCWMGVDA